MTLDKSGKVGVQEPIRQDYDIVVVDDDELELKILVRALRDTQYQMACFQNVEEAMTFLSTQQPRILFVDYRMPELDGISFIEQLAGMYDISDITIFLTSGSQVPPEIANQALELGVRFVEKDEMAEESYLENLCADALARRAQHRVA